MLNLVSDTTEALWNVLNMVESSSRVNANCDSARDLLAISENSHLLALSLLSLVNIWSKTDLSVQNIHWGSISFLSNIVLYDTNWIKSYVPHQNSLYQNVVFEGAQEGAWKDKTASRGAIQLETSAQAHLIPNSTVAKKLRTPRILP